MISTWHCPRTAARSPLVGVAILFALTPVSLHAQPRDLAAVERVVQSAEALAARGQHADGLRRVLGMLDEAESPQVRSRLLFTAGWLHQQLAEQAKGNERLANLFWR